jgi:hypothetical protein
MGIQWIPLAAPIPYITHPKHLKEKSFKVFIHVVELYGF